MESKKQTACKKFLFTFLLLISLFTTVQAQYTLTDNDVVVEDGIIQSCSYNFSNTNIIIPSVLDGQNVIGIRYVSFGEHIFEDQGLTGVQLPSTLESIPTYAFRDNFLTSIIIPASVTSLGQTCFDNNTLTSLIFEDNIDLDNISRESFYGNQLTTVTIPKSVKTISYRAFTSNKLTEVIFEEGSQLTSTGLYAFIYNDISSLNLPNSVTNISDYCFQDNKLTSIHIPSKVLTIGSYSFANNQITSVTFGENCEVTEIESNAFKGNAGLSYITLPAPIKEGYVFLYWEDENGIHYNDGVNITDFTLNYTAIFEENPTTIENVTTCDSYISPSGKYTWTSTGTYLDTVSNVSGEDSVITTNLVILNSTSSTINPTACYSYTSPSEKYTWTTSGTYKDTISNNAGCDSVITIQLTIKEASYSTINKSACNSFTSPSEKYTWTTSGTYKDTIPNSEGCDSVMTFNLTILNSTSSSISETACDSYTSPSEKYIWTTSGTYKDTIENTVGCDSVITINLTVNNSTSSTISESAVDSYTSPSGNYIWNISGTYKDTIPNHVGCDSIITINLTVIYTSSSTVIEDVCDSYDSPSGKYIWTTSGTYKDTIPNSEGADSVITVILTVNYSTSSNLSIAACDDYISPSGKYVWTSTGVYKDTIPNAAGCDSVIVINLTREFSTSSSITATACNSYISPSDKYIWTESGNYKDTIQNIVGCDSVITVNLTINKLDDIEIISQNGLYEITNDGGSLTLNMQTVPEVSECETTWFFGGDTHLASFKNGILSAHGCGEGEVIIRAYSTEDPSVYDEKIITITNQVAGQVTNSQFNTDINNWFLWTPECNNSVVWDNGEAKIIIGDNGSDCWSQFMSEDNMTVEQGKSYAVSFDAYASSDKDIYCKVRENGESYKDLSNEPKFNLTQVKQTYSFEFTASEPTSDIAQIHFNYAGNKDTIWIDNVSFCDKEVIAEILTIKEIQGTTDVSPYKDQYIETEGEVTQVNEYGCFIQDANEAYSGIFIYNAAFSTLEVGDGLKLRGTVEEYNGLTEIKDVVWSETFTSSYNITPLEMTQEVLSEKYESVLVKALSVEAVKENQYSDWIVQHSNETQILVDDKYYTHELTKGNLYNISGIGYYRYGEFTLNPRFTSDIEDLGPAVIPIQITFQVNMQNETVIDNKVGVVGSWDNWSELIPLTANGDIYSASIELNSGDEIQYKFVNSASVSDYENYEIITGDCTSSGNRFFTVSETATTLDLVCFASCEDCKAPKLTIKEIQGNTDISPYINQLVEIEGEVTQVNEYGCFIQDANETYSGIFVYNAAFSSLSIGDGLKVRGTIDEYNGLTELKDVEWSETFSSSYNIVPIEMAQEAISEKYESVLIKASNVEAIEEDSYSNWLVNFSNNVQILIDNKYYEHELKAGNLYNIKGIAYYRFDRFGLNPRFDADIEDLGFAITPVQVTFQVNMKNENVSADGVYLLGSWDNWSQAVELSPNNQVYSALVELTPKSDIEYRFINGLATNNANHESVTGNCAASNGNRQLSVPEVAAILDLVCFGSCEDCSSQTGVNILTKENVKVYPNPANNIVYIDMENIENAKITLTDIIGRILVKKEVKEEKEIIHFESYENGIYFLLIDNGVSMNSFKLNILK